MTSAPPADPISDHVVRELPVYLTTTLTPALHVASHPVRATPLPRLQSIPRAARIKPNAGVIELDVAASTHPMNYDRDRAVELGKGIPEDPLVVAKKKAALLKRGGRSYMHDNNEDELPEKEMDTVRFRATPIPIHDRAPEDAVEGELGRAVTYMVGVMRDNALHLTPVSGLYTVRPDVSHMDRIDELQKTASLKRDIISDDEGDPAVPVKAKAVQMQVKSTAEAEAALAQRNASQAYWLKRVEEEPWRPLSYRTVENRGSGYMFEALVTQDALLAEELVCATSAKDYANTLASHTDAL